MSHDYDALKPFVPKSDIIRCHRCGTSKGEEDKGIFGAWIFGTGLKKYRSIVWFHNVECKTKWKIDHPTNKMKELTNGFAGETGLILIKTEPPEIEDDEI